MKTEKLIEMLQLGEDQQIEFKTACRTQVIGRQVCAFLNTKGGYVVCGVDDQGKILGIGDLVRITKLENELALGLSPSALVSVEKHDIQGKKILVIEVPAGKDIPYAFRDQIYIRRGDITRKADIETIKDMVVRRQVEPERWERRFSIADIASDLDVDEIAAVVKAVNRNLRMEFHDEGDMQAVLQDMAVFKYGRLTNGGDVLFAKNPELRYPQVRVRAVCFTTGKTDDTYRDEKTFAGPLVSVLEEVYRFIVRNTPSLAHFRKGKLERQNEPLYPADAVDEGLVNAFAHRDYADYKGGIAVHIYPRRLEIWNSGSLPVGVTLEKLARGHISVLRNPDIAHVLYLRGMMEKLGRGSLLIQDLCEKQNIPAPEWKSDPDLGVTLTFFAPEMTPEVTPEVKRMLLVISGEMTREEIMEKLGLKDEKHFRENYQQVAVNLGLIEMTIPDKPRSSKQKYRLTEKGKAILKQSGK